MVNGSRQVDGNNQLSRVGLASQVVVVCLCQASQVTRSKVTARSFKISIDTSTFLAIKPSCFSFFSYVELVDGYLDGTSFTTSSAPAN